MIPDRYYFSRLNKKEKEAYKLLYDGVMNLKKKIPLVGIHLTSDGIHRVFHAVTFDNPFLYYFNQTFLNIKYSGQQTVLVPQYFFEREQIEIYNGRIERSVNKIIADLGLNRMSDAEKIKSVHDYFCKRISYDHEAVANDKVDKFVASHSIIGVFSKQKAVCEGISKAFKIVLNTADVKCIIVDGNAGEKSENHSWNIVKINGRPYHIDLTWDLANSKASLINYDYYNVTDGDISKDHSDFHGVPQCLFKDENYFTKNNLVFGDKTQLYKYLADGIESGRIDYYFKYTGTENLQNLMSGLIQFLVQGLAQNGINGRVMSSMRTTQQIGRIAVERNN